MLLMNQVMQIKKREKGYRSVEKIENEKNKVTNWKSSLPIRNHMMVIHTLLTCIVVPNTVDRIKHLRIFVLALLLIVYPSDWSDTELFCHNWFSSLSLTRVLEDQGIKTTGNVRAERLGILKIKKKDLKKQK